MLLPNTRLQTSKVEERDLNARHKRLGQTLQSLPDMTGDKAATDVVEADIVSFWKVSLQNKKLQLYLFAFLRPKFPDKTEVSLDQVTVL